MIFDKFIAFIVFISKLFAAIGIAAGVLLAFINVVGRYVFHSSFTWAGELTIYLFLWSIFFGTVYCFAQDAHIAVDLFRAKVSPRIAAVLRFIALSVALIYCLAMVYYGYEYILLYIDLGEVSIDLDIPLWIPYAVVPLSFALSALILIHQLLHLFKGD